MDARFRVIGPGRAGRAFGRALEDAGWSIASPAFLGRHDDVRTAALGVDLLLVTTPDDTIAEVAAKVQPVDDTVVAHIAGSLGTDVLAPHSRRAAIHPLVSLPDYRADRLKGAWFGVSGDPMAWQIVAELGGRPLLVTDDARTTYHAAAVIASNHLVALLGQVQRVAATVGVPLDAYLELARGALDNVATLGPAHALTGPVARGDWETVARHLAALPPEERAGYQAMAHLATRLSEQAVA